MGRREELIELGKWFYHLALAVAAAGLIKPLFDQKFSWYTFIVALGLLVVFLATGFHLIRRGQKEGKT